MNETHKEQIRGYIRKGLDAVAAGNMTLAAYWIFEALDVLASLVED